MPLVRKPIVNRFLQIAACCSLLLVSLAAPGYGTETTAAASHQRAIGDNSKRSLNNYMVSSMPYMVDTKSLNLSSSVAMWQLNEFAKDEQQPSAYSLHDETVVECSDIGGESQCVKDTASASPAENSAEATFRPYSQEELNKILQKYEVSDDMRAQETSNAAAAVLYNGNGQRKDEEPSSSLSSSSSAAGGDGGVLEPSDKSKSWNLINSQNFKNPYDDRMGWVTLEPIAWSSSQVQKWEPNQKPIWPPPSQVNQHPQQQQQQQNGQHWSSGPQQQQLQPSYSWTTDRPWKRPTYQYQQQKPWSGNGANQNYGKPSPYGSASSPFGQTQDIITDGQPGYFPQDRPSSQSVAYNSKPWLDQSHAPSSGGFETYNRPPPSQIVYQGGGGGGGGGGSGHHPVAAARPPSSSLDGDGHWVLLSSTKGYSIPQRQKSSARSLDLTSGGAGEHEHGGTNESPPTKSKSSRRTVRLTVLPPLPGSTKTVTSHGGMIEVESTKQTVDEAHREHLARMMRLHQNGTGHPAANEVLAAPSATSTRSRVDSGGQLRDKRNGLLAAVGAGMIPATMAMLLPLLMGRRKRDSLTPEVKQPNVVTLNFKKFDRPGIVTRYTRRAGKDRPLFAKSYALYE